MPSRQQQLGKLLDSEVKKLLGIFQELENVGKEAIIKGISSELTEAKKQALLNQIKRSAIVADGRVKQWLSPAISGVYVDGVDYVDEQLKKFNIGSANSPADPITVQILKESPDMRPHLDAVNSLMSDAYLDFGSGITGWVKGNEHILNEVVRRQVQSKLAVGRLTGEGVQEIKRDIKSTLQSQGLEALIDRGGRQWTLNRYGEMLTRTHLIRANTDAAINRFAESEVDIVEVSTHGTTDEVCLRYEGNIYSLSGKSKNYPKIPLLPPFHPNCKHSLLPRPELE